MRRQQELGLHYTHSEETCTALGPSSAAANVVMKHAVLNQNKALVADLIEENVPVSGELLHLIARVR